MLQNALNTLECKNDSELVGLIKEKADSDAFTEVCRRYENIFYKICQKYVSALSMSGVNPQDIFDEKNFIIFHCVSTFEEKHKAKLSTWIGNYARYLCLNSINARKFIHPSTDNEIKQYIENAQTVSSYLHSGRDSAEDYKYILNLLNQLKDPRILGVFKLRYFEQRRMIWAQIAKKMGISTQTAINLHNRGIELIRRKLKSENISDVV